MEDNHQESYKMLFKDVNPLSYKDVAEDWGYRSKSESSVRAVREMSAKCPPSVRQVSANI